MYAAVIPVNPAPRGVDPIGNIFHLSLFAAGVSLSRVTQLIAISATGILWEISRV